MVNTNSQIALVNGDALTERDMFSAIDGVIEDLYAKGNLKQATSVLNILDKIDNVTGKVKAKLLWGMSRWYTENKPQEDFGDYVESTTPTRRITVERYINVWEQIEQERIPKKIQERPMRDLVPIASMLSQDFEPSKKEWDEINLSSNSSELADIIRKVKGKKPRKSGMTIQMERDGSINVYKDDKKAYVGFLDLEEAKTNPDVDKAIERIVSGANIIRR